ncbi:hypothetical protein [Stieleria neptunia]|uniref:hypothetical protein n=1 Tax=Stieleria neptunia TaxID=2527979 RepID=UPI0011A4124E|nr:hypothetical protein [Stieleria neptunia]
MNESNPYKPIVDSPATPRTGCLAIIGWTFVWLVLLGLVIPLIGVLGLMLTPSSAPAPVREAVEAAE